MGFLSKAWKGVRKVVKKAARGVKKLAKKIAYATPGGKQAWDFSSKVGKGITKVVGKVVSAIGPVGMIALSILAPYAAPLWAAFGAAAAAAGGIMGTVGTAIFTAGNWVAGTLSAMSSGISKAIGTIADGGLSGLASGSLSEAGSQVATGFAEAFTGKAGMTAVGEAATQAGLDAAIAKATGESAFKTATDKIMNDITGASTSSTATNITNDTANKAIEESMGPHDFSKPFGSAPQASQAPDAIAQQIASGQTNASAATVAKTKLQNEALVQSSGGTMATNLTTTTGSSLLSKATDVAKAMLDNQPDQLGIQEIQPVGDVGGRTFGGNAFGRGSGGSEGGQFLSQAMLQAMQAQQQRMARGFG